MVFFNSPTSTGKPAIRSNQSNTELPPAFRYLCSHSAKIKNNQTPGTRARSTQLLCLRSGALAPELPFLCSGLGLVSGRPCFQAIDRSNAWTALRRPLAGRSRSLNHPDRSTLRLPTALRYTTQPMPRCEAVLLLPISNTVLRPSVQAGEPHGQPMRPSGASPR